MEDLWLKFNGNASYRFRFYPSQIYDCKAGLINFRAGRDIKEVKQQRNKVIHSSAAHKNFTTHILSNRTQSTRVYINHVFMLLMRCVCVLALFCLCESWKELLSTTRWCFVTAYVSLPGLSAPSHTQFCSCRCAHDQCFLIIKERPQSAWSHNFISTVQPSARRSMADALFKFTVWIWRGTGSRRRVHISNGRLLVHCSAKAGVNFYCCCCSSNLKIFFHKEKPNKTHKTWRF